jgi:lipopolysaccharide export system protein LptA
MTCDSAYYYSDENIVDAFSNVHLWQGDTLNLYGDYLKYNGNEKIAQVRRNVILLDNENKLTTNYIDHDFSKNLAYYIGGGNIINGNNTLSSEQGYYYTKEKLFFFKDSVVVVNPDYTMYSDTLKYNTVTEVSYFLGPTDIIAQDNYIYCENGWYDTKNNISQFNKNAYLESGGKILKGDSLYYERETGVGRAFYHVELIDTSQNIILQGNRAIYNENTEFAELTDKALMIQVDKGDSLFIHADTLKSVSDTIPESRMIKAYYHVKIFREDLQGKCDSLIYTDIDSAFRFYGEPVLWSDDNQITAEFIEIYTKNQALDRIEIINTAFIISQEDSVRFNQIKGRNMTAYVKNNQLQTIDVNGNAQTVYYAKEGLDIIGANKAESSNLQLRFKDNKIHRIIYLTLPDGAYYPLYLLPENMEKLENFKWFNEYRPLKKEDVFSWITNKKENQLLNLKK